MDLVAAVLAGMEETLFTALNFPADILVTLALTYVSVVKLDSDARSKWTFYDVQDSYTLDNIDFQLIQPLIMHSSRTSVNIRRVNQRQSNKPCVFDYSTS